MMGNPCRFQNTLLFNRGTLRLESIKGFAFSYLLYNDSIHIPEDGVMFHESHGELYYNVLKDLPLLLDKSPYLQELVRKFKRSDMESLIRKCEDEHDVIFPSYLTDRALTHEVMIHKLVKEKVR